MTMEVVANNFMPGDSRLVEQLVYELKSQGIFDRFRKECIADVDTKPAYQNLRQRVEGSVSTFLRQQTWSPDTNKNQVREQLRKNIYESGYLETGVERIVDQVVNPKINTIFLPEVEDVVYRFLGVVKPVRDIKKEVKINIEDLLPTDLEAVSPESVHSFKDDIKPEDHSETLNDSLNSGSKPDEDESPPFEPLDPANKISNEENSVDSHLSGFSGLQSHGSNHSGDNRVCQMEISSQDSQLSHNSSESRLSIITSEDVTKMDICEDSSSNLMKSSTNKTPTETSILSKMDVDEIMPCDETDNAGDISMEESLGSSVTRKENESSSDNIYKVDKSANENSGDKKIEKTDENKSDKKHDKTIEKKSKSSDRYSKDKRDDKHRKSSSSSNKDISSSKYSSSKDRDRSRKDSKSSSSTRGKEKIDKSREKPDRDKEKKDKGKDKTEKERSDRDKERDVDKSAGKDKAEKERSDREKERDVDKSAKDKEKVDKDKSSGRDKERSDKSKDKSEREKLDKDKVKTEKSSRDKEKSTKDKEREKSDKEKERSDRDKVISEKDKDKERPDKEKERSDKDKERSDKDRERSDKDKERSDKDKERSDKDRERSDKDKERSDKDRDRSNKEKERSDKEKDKSRRDKDKSDRERSSKDQDKSARPREKSDKQKTDRHKEKYREKDKYHKEKSSKEKETSDKEKSLESKTSSKDKIDRPSSSSKKEHSDKEKPRSSSSSSSRDKSKLDNGETKSRSSADKSRKDSKHSVNGKPSGSSSDSRRDKDSKRDSKKQLKDDHYGAKDKKNDRRSTDRDSNDGSSSKPNFFGSCSENNSSRSEKSSQEFTSNSGSGDSGNSDQVEQSEPARYEEPAPVVQDVQRLIMPKFAANFQEVRRIMKIRKQLALLDKQKRLGFTHIESQVLVENGLPGKAKATRPVKQKKPDKKQPYEKRKIPVGGKENAHEKKDIEEKVRLGESLELICEEVADAGVVGAEVSLEQDADEVRAETPDSPWNSTSLRSTELSQENWEALEARLAQEMSTVNYNSYESDEEMAYSASPRRKDAAEAPEAAADASNFEGSDPKGSANESEGFLGFPKEEGTNRCLEFLRSFISESISRYPALADENFGRKTAGSEVNHENHAQNNNNKKLFVVMDKNDMRKNNHRLEPAVEITCRYLEKPALEEANLRFLRGFIGKLEEELRVCTEARRVGAQPAKRGRKRKLEEIVDVKNNNRDHYDQVVVRKRGRPPGSHTVLSKVNKEKMCNTTDLLTHEKFSLPLSPAESDKSNDKKEEELPIPEKRRRIIATQRYSSEDLYKPRPIFCRRNKDARKS